MSLRAIINGRAMYGDEDFERELEKAYREGRREERERMEEHYGYGERRGVKGTGPYSRYYRRRR